MQDFAVARLDDEAEYGHLRQVIVAKEVEIGDLGQAGHDTPFDIFLKLSDCLNSDLLTQLVDETSANILNNARGSCLFKLLHIGHEVMVLFVNEENGAAANTIRKLVVKK